MLGRCGILRIITRVLEGSKGGGAGDIGVQVRGQSFDELCVKDTEIDKTQDARRET